MQAVIGATALPRYLPVPEHRLWQFGGTTEGVHLDANDGISDSAFSL